MKRIIFASLFFMCHAAIAAPSAPTSLESTWGKAYETYGYNKSFVSDFLDAVNENKKDRVYHLGRGTIICNSKESAEEFAKNARYGNGSNGCFQVYFRKVVAFKFLVKGKKLTKYKFIMTSQPAWRYRFFDNKVGRYAVYEGWTHSDFEVNKLQWEKFVDADIKRFNKAKQKIKNINNMPDKKGRYPLL